MFSKPPQERVGETLTALDGALKSGNGWVMYVFTQLNDQGYSFYCQFKDSNRVNMLSDLNSQSATIIKQSSYRTQWMQEPSLIFDTYNYLHLLSDPMPSQSNVGGAAGQGLISDFSFGLTAETIDTLNNFPDKLTQLITVGRYNELKVRFYKLSAASADFWRQGKIKDFMADVTNFVAGHTINGVNLSGNKIQINFGDKNVKFTWLDGGNVKSKSMGFAYGVNMLVLEDTITVGSEKFYQFTWSNNKLYLSSDAHQYLIEDLGVPVIPLNQSWGNVYTGMYADYYEIYPGTSSAGADILNYFFNGLGNRATGYIFNYGYIEMKIDTDEHVLVLNGFSSQNGGNSGWVTTASYSYTMDGEGNYSFTLASPFSGGYVAVILSKLQDFILNDKIKMDYYLNKGVIYAQLQSVNKPDITMTFQLY